MLAYFQHGGHEPEVVIFYHLHHLAGLCKSYITASAYDKCDEVYASSVRQCVMHQTDH